MAAIFLGLSVSNCEYAPSISILDWSAVRVLFNGVGRNTVQDLFVKQKEAIELMLGKTSAYVLYMVFWNDYTNWEFTSRQLDAMIPVKSEYVLKDLANVLA